MVKTAKELQSKDENVRKEYREFDARLLWHCVSGEGWTRAEEALTKKFNVANNGVSSGAHEAFRKQFGLPSRWIKQTDLSSFWTWNQGYKLCHIARLYFCVATDNREPEDINAITSVTNQFEKLSNNEIRKLTSEQFYDNGCTREQALANYSWDDPKATVVYFYPGFLESLYGKNNEALERIKKVFAVYTEGTHGISTTKNILSKIYSDIFTYGKNNKIDVDRAFYQAQQKFSQDQARNEPPQTGFVAEAAPARENTAFGYTARAGILNRAPVPPRPQFPETPPTPYDWREVRYTELGVALNAIAHPVVTDIFDDEAAQAEQEEFNDEEEEEFNENRDQTDIDRAI